MCIVKCCNFVFGDFIEGYIIKGRGVVIYCLDC